jgi:hypothetical protein
MQPDPAQLDEPARHIVEAVPLPGVSYENSPKEAQQKLTGSYFHPGWCVWQNA